MEKERRKWCRIWSQKFPSFFHDPLTNFTYCRLCRNSSVHVSRTCAWAVGHGPPTSGWRVRRLMRHLASTEHVLARQTALDICKKGMDIEAQAEDGRECDGWTNEQFSDPWNLLGPSDQFTAPMNNITFKEVARLLNIEIVMMKAYSNSYIPKKYLNLGQVLADSAGYGSPSMVIESKVPELECSEPLEITGEEVDEDFVEPELVEIYTEAAASPSPEPPQAKRRRLDDSVAQREDQPPIHATPNKSNGPSSSVHDDTLDIPIESLLCLPESLQLLADSQSRIANAVESMVTIQKDMLSIMKEVSESLKKSKS